MGVPLEDEGKGSEVGSAQGGHVQKKKLFKRLARAIESGRSPRYILTEPPSPSTVRAAQPRCG